MTFGPRPPQCFLLACCHGARSKAKAPEDPASPALRGGQRLELRNQRDRPHWARLTVGLTHPEDPGAAVSRATGCPTCSLCVMEPGALCLGRAENFSCDSPQVRMLAPKGSLLDLNHFGTFGFFGISPRSSLSMSVTRSASDLQDLLRPTTTR